MQVDTGTMEGLRGGDKRKVGWVGVLGSMAPPGSQRTPVWAGLGQTGKLRSQKEGAGRGGRKTGTQDLGLPPQGRDLWWTGGEIAQVHSSPLGSLLWGAGYPWSTSPHWWAGSCAIPPDPKALPISQSELYAS